MALEHASERQPLARRQQLLVACLLTLAYALLRNHPLSYDIGRHVDMFQGSRESLLQVILPIPGSFELLRYGVLCLLAPLTPVMTVTVFWVLGWICFLSYGIMAAFWSQATFRKIWPGLTAALLIALYGGRKTLLFANHPYECATHLILAALFAAGSRMPRATIAFACAGLLIHPNVVAASACTLALNWKWNRSHAWPAIAAFALCGIYYLVTGRSPT